LAICLFTYDKISNVDQVRYQFKIPYANHQLQSDMVQGKLYVGLRHFHPLNRSVHHLSQVAITWDKPGIKLRVAEISKLGKFGRNVRM
jgi:hypothetical protein